MGLLLERDILVVEVVKVVKVQSTQFDLGASIETMAAVVVGRTIWCRCGTTDTHHAAGLRGRRTKCMRTSWSRRGEDPRVVVDVTRAGGVSNSGKERRGEVGICCPRLMIMALAP